MNFVLHQLIISKRVCIPICFDLSPFNQFRKILKHDNFIIRYDTFMNEFGNDYSYEIMEYDYKLNF
jgi:hypothetical protein